MTRLIFTFFQSEQYVLTETELETTGLKTGEGTADQTDGWVFYPLEFTHLSSMQYRNSIVSDSSMYAGLTHICGMDYPIITIWTSQLSILE